jgi:hypothetical protein
MDGTKTFCVFIRTCGDSVVHRYDVTLVQVIVSNHTIS